MPYQPRNVLIIKLGYSETLDGMLSPTTSLGDVLRSTFILHYFKNDDVHWLVDEIAMPLLESNEFIRAIYNYSPATCQELSRMKFDIVINFEKMRDVCVFAQGLQTKSYFGFRSSGNGIEAHPDDAAAGMLVSLSQDMEKKRRNRECWQKILANAIGQSWSGQPYVLGYRPASDVKWDIGFNWATSAKWENKTWPRPYWNELSRLLQPRYSVSWQQGMDSLYDKQGKYPEAAETLKRAIEYNPNDERMYAAISSVYLEMGQTQLADEYDRKAKRAGLDYYLPITVNNYRKLKTILDGRGIKLVCVQYPMRSVKPLKKIFEGEQGVVFVDNEALFREAVKRHGHEEYFVDRVGGDFGHCTEKGNRLLAENIANTILKEVFNKQ